jgi:hypothetical protein
VRERGREESRGGRRILLTSDGGGGLVKVMMNSDKDSLSPPPPPRPLFSLFLLLHSGRCLCSVLLLLPKRMLNQNIVLKNLSRDEMALNNLLKDTWCTRVIPNPFRVHNSDWTLFTYS